MRVRGGGCDKDAPLLALKRERLQAKECGWPLQAAKGKKWILT